MKAKVWPLPLIGLGMALATLTASATPVTFVGVDAGAGPSDPHTQSNAAAAAFDMAASGLGSEQFISFEKATLGYFAAMTVAPGVTLSQPGITSSVRNSPVGAPSPLFGYNTTAGGSQFLDIQGSSITFTFTNPVNSFAGFFTGVQNFGTETIAFNDGTSRTISLAVAAPTLGGVEFVGFSDLGAQISSITINAGLDAIGLDDVRYTPAVAVTPEPSTLSLMALGLTLLTWLYKHRQKAPQT